MHRRIPTLLAVIGATTILVLAANTAALATTGHALLIGRFNSSTHATTISRSTSGAALSVHTHSRLNAPLAVNGRGRVANLNADLVDGLDSTALRTRAFVFTAEPINEKDDVRYTLKLPSGSYVVNYSNFFSGAKDGGIECFLEQDIPGHQTLFTGYSSLVHDASQNWDPALAGSGLVTKVAAGSIVVRCDAQDTFSTEDGLPLRITATPIKIVSSQAIHPDEAVELAAPRTQH